MFKRKQDLDKHVQSVLRRKKDEKERYAQGYQIARLYKEIHEYETARRYLAGFLQVRDNNCQAHQLMGEINEGLGKIEAAIESYKRALDLGGFSSSNRHLVLRICELFCEQGTDIQRMKYWLEKCEALYPKSDVIFRLKAQIAAASSNGTSDNVEMEKILIGELINRPSDVELRIKLLNIYADTNRVDEAYDTAVSTDLTTAFTNNLQWYQCLQNVYKLYREKNTLQPDFLLLHLHVLRNLVYLSLSSNNIATCIESLRRFDLELKEAHELGHQDEAWNSLCGEMKGQFFYLAGLLLLKRATTGSLSWSEANQMSGACFLASQKVSPLDAQAPWFVKPPEGHLKFYQWWHLQSYDRLSQVGHTIRQLAGNDVADWSKTVGHQMMTGMGQHKVFNALYANVVPKVLTDLSFFYDSHLMVGKLPEPLSWRQLLDIDRVACQVHLGKLPHLVWLCLQRYAPEMKSQPNYHFALMENMRFSVKNLEPGSCESLCQLDILAFLLATVRCAVTSLAESNFLYQDSSGRPSLLPACISRPLCSTEQEEWWNTMYQFCTNTVRDDFSRLRRLLMRGIEAVRLLGSHGVSVPMQCHLARCLDSKVESLRKAELGSRCSAAELSALEDRAHFYWVKSKSSLERLQKNQQLPLVKNCMFKESRDVDLTPQQVQGHLVEARFAIAKCSLMRGKHEEALEGFRDHASPWASYYSGEIYMSQAEMCGKGRQDEVYKALIRKARDCFYQTLDHLNGDKSHELNGLVSKELEDLEVEIQSFDWGDTVDSSKISMNSMSSAVPADISAIGLHNPSLSSLCSTPRPLASHSSPAVNGNSPPGTKFQSTSEADSSFPHHSFSSTSNLQPRPSPEKLESQIKSLGYSQTTLFKMVLDRNEELVLMHSRMMEEHRNNNNELKTVLTENKIMMEELKAVLAENKLLIDRQKTESKEVVDGLKKENKDMMEELKSLMVETRDMLKLMKTDLASFKPGIMPPHAMPPGPPLIMGAHLPQGPPRGPFPGFPGHQPGVVPPYPGYLLNSAMHPPPPPVGPPQPGPAGNYRPSGMPGSRMAALGKYKTSGDEDDDDEEPDHGEDLSGIYSEYYDPDQSFSQYFTPDAHVQDWSLRPPMDNALPMSPAMQPPRMTMPQPGFFSSALRGQALQYGQAGQPSPAVPPNLIRPGFFSTPSTSAFVTPSSAPSVVNTSGMSSSSGNIFAGLSNVGTPMPAVSTSQAPASTWASQSANDTAGFEILLLVKAFLPARSAAGAITILSTPINKSSVVMMSDAKEMLFHHDISGLKLASSNNTVVTWTAMKIGSTDKESVSVKVDTDEDAETLKQILLKQSFNSMRPYQSVQSPAAAASVANAGNVAPTTPVTPANTHPPPACAKETGDSSEKTVFGKFTFSGTPKLTIDESKPDREKAVPHKTPPAVANEDAPKPFAGFSFKLPSTSPTTQPSPGSKPDTGATNTPSKTMQPSPAMGSWNTGRGDEERTDEYEPNIDFKPVITLPALVEKKTGEEDETAILVERCRMFRYDQTTFQWKERGVGELKILSNKNEARYRVVMRRDQILKLCANHFISEDMKLTPLASSERSWCYNAMDFSEEEMKMENLAVKFKNTDTAKRFKETFAKCQATLEASKKDRVDASPVKPVPSATTSAFAVSPPKTTSASPVKSSTSSLTDLFKPKSGSWECPACLVRNVAEAVICPACETCKPGTAVAPAPSTTSAAASTTSGAWGGLFKPKTTSASPVKSSTSSLTDLFKPKTGSWECTGCYIRNNADVLKCPACETLKPGVKKEDLPKTEDSAPGSSGFMMKPSGGFTFGGPIGAASTPPVSGKNETAAPAPAQEGFTFNANGGFSFGPPSVAPATSAPPAMPAPSASSSTAPSSTTGPDTSASGSTGGGFTFAPGGGITFGSVDAPKATDVSLPTPASAASSSATTDVSVTPSIPSKDKPGESLLASLLTSNDPDETEKKEGSLFNFSMTSSKPTTGSLFGQPAVGTSPGPSKFNFFTFNKTPPQTQTQTQPQPQPQPQPQTQTPVKSPTEKKAPTKVVPSSPEVDEHGMYVTKEEDDTHIHFEPIVKLPQNLEMKTGEEDENILFESRGKMYRFTDGQWKERGLGVVKILEHRENKTTRVLMRRDRILKLCCNHRIDPSLSLQPMVNADGKAWVWYALDFSDEEPKMEKLALRFRTSEIASDFKNVFERCKLSAGEAGQEVVSDKDRPQSKQAEEEDDDVIFVKEEFPARDGATQVKTEEPPGALGEDAVDSVMFVKQEVASKEQIQKARAFLLPDHFHLYETKPRCPGCLGCTDGEGLPSWAAKPAAAAAPEKAPLGLPASSKPAVSSGQQEVPFGQSFGSGLPDFAKLAQEEPSETLKTETEAEPCVFGAGVGLDFSSLAGKSATDDFAFKKVESSSPFKFHGAGQTLFKSPDGGDGGDEESVAANNDIHFEPVIALPDLVEVKTGEEDWNIIFIHRAKMYKFYTDSGQWKECGLGDIKIMKHNYNTQFRVLMRRDQILKLACNHFITTDMNLKPMASSETAWCWVAQDYSDGDGESKVEQFAVKFKKKTVAQDFKTIFEDCQAKLREASEEKGKENVLSGTSCPQSEIKEETVAQGTFVGDSRECYSKPSSYVPLGQGEVTEQAVTQSTAVPLGDKGNVYHSKALDVIGQDRVQPSSYVPLGQGEVTEQAVTQSTAVPLGDKGNVYHSKALDVIGQDRVQPSSYVPLGQGEVTEQAVTQSTAVPLGDKGNVYHSKALDVIGQDRVQPSSYVPLSQGEVTEQAVTQSMAVPLGDKGNVYHSKALDVIGQDRVKPSSYTPLGKGEVTEQAVTQSTTVPLGDKGNVYHSKALDVIGQDRVHPSSYVPLGQGEVTEQAVTQSTAVPLGDKGNVYHSMALDVIGQDRVQPSSYVPLSQGEVTEQPVTQSMAVPLGDKGNVYHSKALDVIGQDRVKPSSYTPLGKGEVTEQAVTQNTAVPLGDKGNVYHSKALDVIGQDRVQPSSYVPLGQGEVTEQAVTQSMAVPLGDKGNVYHSKALDVIGQDRVQPSSYVPLGQGEVTEQAVTQSTAVPLGDKGNVYHSKALDVIGQDRVQLSSYVPLGQGEVTEQAVTQSTAVPLGDKGNVYHNKALDVIGQDRVQLSSYVPLGQGEVTEQAVTQSMAVPLGDKGNVYHSKALDVIGQDRVQPSSYVPLGQGEVTEQAVTQSTAVPLGDKGNVYHSKALDVIGQDRVQLSSYVPLGQGEVTEQAVTQSTAVPLGDKGNVYHSKALDVIGQDRVQPSSYVPLGQGEVTEQAVAQSTAVPLGNRGNVYHSKALDVIGQDRVQPSSYVPLGQGEVTEQAVTPSTAVPLGNRGNVYHSKALDVIGQDRVQPSSYVPLGQGEVTEQAVTPSTAVPLGNRGNVYHSKALDVIGQDRVQPSSYVPLGQGEVTEQAVTQSTAVPLGDKGNVYHSKALDVIGQDRVQPSSYVPLGQGEVTEQAVTQSTAVPLGDKGNVYHSKALDVMGQDQVRPLSCHPLGQRGKESEVHRDPSSASGFQTEKPSSQWQGQKTLSYAEIVRSLAAASSSPPAGHGPTLPTPSHRLEHPCSSTQSTSAVPAVVTSTTTEDADPSAEAGNTQDEQTYEDDDDDDEEEKVIFEKRATLSHWQDNGWKKLGLGQLQVKYNEDVNGNSVEFYTDDNVKMCSHIICREHKISLNAKTRSCEWQPIDFSMDEPLRRRFNISFSSVPAAEEYAKVFTEGQRLAVDSELSEKLSTEIDIPEVFSGGGPRQ